MKATSLLLIGGGGHASVVIDQLQSMGISILGIVDANPSAQGVLGVPILGGYEVLDSADSRECPFLVTVGSARASDVRTQLWRRALAAGLQPADLVIHQSAEVSQTAELGKGSVVLRRAIVNTNARIGSNVILNTASIVEHDCIIDDHVHVSIRACLCGNVSVGEGSFVGAGTVIRQGIRIGKGVTIGAGSTVIRDVPDGWTVAGVPAVRINTGEASR